MINSKINSYYLFGITLLVLFLSPSITLGYFSGEAEATDNSFDVGTLDISVDNDTHSVNVDSSSNESFSFTANDVGTIASQYELTAAPTICSSSFFNGLDVEVTQGSVVYDGQLSALNATSSSGGLWTVMVTAGSIVAADNEQCEVQLTLRAWQTEFPLWNTGGFSEEITMTLIVTATDDIGPQPTANVVLNEVYAHPNNASSTPYDIEWIELYNGTGSDVDVANWSIGEMSGVNTNQHEIVSSCPGSNLSDYMEPLSGSSTVIPAGGLKVFKFCGNSSYLNQGNSGDTVTLHMSTSSAAIDTYVYTSSQLGKSDARIPDGGTWVDPIPSPGESNMSTITVEDLEAEGWSEELIQEVLGVVIEEASVPVATPLDGDDEGGDLPPEMPDAKEEEQQPSDPEIIDGNESIETKLPDEDVNEDIDKVDAEIDEGEIEEGDDVEIDDNEGDETEPVDGTLVDAADDVDKEKEEEIKPEESEEKELNEEPIPKDEEPNIEDTSSQSADSSPVTTE
ncbi:hypothetical protein COU14_01220 [Candidatus Kaiserbacteria bacterium CG10_big_fil_rev_8_21_14_0_10_44_10]|uniref:LTD domain-containing protein n=1 Tax=Candidatus Kaiserbacteria bacterium CG10_big_fil_rev_8_21_14_0_10_44_10 TaxID=1974606 RepID=A0A2H0UJZ8_9BACT|nr:MAG: hypothetical protein COU14_01220 [Candidatus Kaiserbacteria bacterium CG10_big_fil_rev_8_21_14_0_10_44_10]